LATSLILSTGYRGFSAPRSAEDAVDEVGDLGGADAEVAAGGLQGGVAEDLLDVGEVGSALAQPGGQGVPQVVRTQLLQPGVGADGQDDLRQPGNGQRSALPGPERAGFAAAHVEPAGEGFAAVGGEGDGADLVALAVQAHMAAPRGDRDVLQLQAGGLLHPGAGGEEDGDDGAVTGAAPGGGLLRSGLVGLRQRVGLPGQGGGAFDRDPDAELGVQERERGERLVEPSFSILILGRGALDVYLCSTWGFAA
jgi:hypothetical protein